MMVGLFLPWAFSVANASMKAGWSLPKLVKMYSIPSCVASSKIRQAAVAGVAGVNVE